MLVEDVRRFQQNKGRGRKVGAIPEAEDGLAEFSFDEPVDGYVRIDDHSSKPWKVRPRLWSRSSRIASTISWPDEGLVEARMASISDINCCRDGLAFSTNASRAICSVDLPAARAFSLR